MVLSPKVLQVAGLVLCVVGVLGVLVEQPGEQGSLAITGAILVLASRIRVVQSRAAETKEER